MDIANLERDIRYASFGRVGSCQLDLALVEVDAYHLARRDDFGQARRVRARAAAAIE